MFNLIIKIRYVSIDFVYFVLVHLFSFLCINKRDICLVSEKVEAIGVDLKEISVFRNSVFWFEMVFLSEYFRCFGVSHFLSMTKQSTAILCFRTYNEFYFFNS